MFQAVLTFLASPIGMFVCATIAASAATWVITSAYHAEPQRDYKSPTVKSYPINPILREEIDAALERRPSRFGQR